MAFYSAKYKDMPKNDGGPDKWYIVDPKCSGAVTGCTFEHEHWETGCNESYTQEQKPEVNWQNAELSCRFLSLFVQTGPSSGWSLFFVESKTVVRFSMMRSLSAFESARTVEHKKSKYRSPQEHRETSSKGIQLMTHTLCRTLLRGNHVPLSTGAPGDW